jgi:hypothetical protein
MFMLLALISFILAEFQVHLGSIDLVILGFIFMATHFLIGVSPWSDRFRARNPN